MLFAARVDCALKLMEMEPDKPNLSKAHIVDKAIDDVGLILERIDKKWPAKS